MQKTLNTFFLVSVLLMFIYNVSGISICIDHSQHQSSKTFDIKNSKDNQQAKISKEDHCQCALHFQMNHSLLPDLTSLDFSVYQTNKREIPQSKSKTYRCLLDYFSSRAPPCFL